MAVHILIILYFCIFIDFLSSWKWASSQFQFDPPPPRVVIVRFAVTLSVGSIWRQEIGLLGLQILSTSILNQGWATCSHPGVVGSHSAAFLAIGYRGGHPTAAGRSQLAHNLFKARSNSETNRCEAVLHTSVCCTKCQPRYWRYSGDSRIHNTLRKGPQLATYLNLTSILWPVVGIKQ